MELKTNGKQNGLNSEELEEFESSGLEKLIGIFVEPVRIFRSVRQFGSNIYDWLIPILFFLITVLLADLMITAIPSIRFSMLEKQALEIREKFSPLVEAGELTEESVNNEIEELKKRYEAGLTEAKFFEALFITVSELIKFGIVLLFFHFLLKYLYKGDLKISHSLSAIALPLYIKAFGNVFLIIAGLATSSYLSDLSLGTLAGIRNNSTAGFLLHRLDIFSIWYFSLVAFGFMVLHRFTEKYKILTLVITVWLTSGLFFFLLARIFGIGKSYNL